MAVNTPAGIVVTPQSGLYVPDMAQEPLLTALQNLNYLWKYHRPPLVDVCPNLASGSRDAVLVIPVIPSVDRLDYTFETRAWPSATSTCTISVDYSDTYAGGGTVWTNIFSNAGIATTANTLLTRVDANHMIPETATVLRWTVTPVAGNLQLHHCLAYPTPGDATTGIQASGFIPFDDGLLVGVAGSPVTTEHLNRCKTSTIALLQDRYQMAFSFVQKETGTPHTVLTQTASNWRSLPPFRVYLPHQGPKATLHIRAIADVDAGGTADLIHVGPLKGETTMLTLDADGTLQTGAIDVELSGTGLQRYVDLRIEANASGGHTTRLRAVVGFWRPTE